MYTDTRDRRPHGNGPHADQYTTTTLYTDTPDQDVFHRRGSYGRSKYRVRRYGASDVVFLERKLRTKSLLSKRRSIVPVEDLARLGTPAATDMLWIGDWFLGRLVARRLAPVCQVTYSRTARVTQTPYGLARLTVDAGLAARPISGWAYEAPVYEPALVGHHIVELKYIVAMPVVFKRLIETFGLEPMTISKYRLSVAALGAVQEVA